MKKLVFIILILIILYSSLMLIVYINSENDNVIADVGIVFGNKVELSGEPSERLKARLFAAKLLYEQKKIAKIIVSGGVGSEGFDEAFVMEKYLVNSGIPYVDIITDSEGNNSHLTSINAFDILGKNASVIAISQRYHLPRAKLSLKNSGFQRVYGFAPKYNELRDVYAYAREIPAWLKYWYKGL